MAPHSQQVRDWAQHRQYEFSQLLVVELPEFCNLEAALGWSTELMEVKDIGKSVIKKSGAN